MKLLYLWIENFEERIRNQGFLFSSEYVINFEYEESRLFIQKREDYFPKFYGERILDITAVAGKNGSGKTTLARCVYQMCKGLSLVDTECDETFSEQMIVYLDNQEKIWVFYYLKQEPVIYAETEYEAISLLNTSENTLNKAENVHKMSVVYFTNAILIDSMIPNHGMGEYTEYSIEKSIAYSPMAALQSEFGKTRELYGAESTSGDGFLYIIRRYSENMVSDARNAYLSSFSYNYLLMVRYSPGSIARMIPVLNRKFELIVLEFGEYILRQKKISMLSEVDKSVFVIRKIIYEKIIKDIGVDIYGKIYANILCEIILFLNLFTGECLNRLFKMIEKGVISHANAYDLENILQQSDEKEFIMKIYNIGEVDITLLDEFFNITEKKGCILKQTVWYEQIKKFKEQYMLMGKKGIPNIIDDGYIEIIQILLDSHDKGKTVWWRMLKIIPSPVSSGEMALINIFASVYQLKKRNTDNNILFILDEIDAYLHPKWQQEVLTHIIRWINENENFEDKKVQIILTSHSPIMLSDIPRDMIIRMNDLKKVEVQSELTFGANINQLFYDSFFMQEGSIGNIAKTKIQKVINYLNGEDCISQEEAEYIIKNIGEPIVQRKLLNDFRLKLWGHKND